MKMQPRDGAAADPEHTWCLADDDGESVLFYSLAGASITLLRALSRNSYTGLWFDPRTGATRPLEAPVSGAAGTVIRKPTAEPWLCCCQRRAALVLRRRFRRQIAVDVAVKENRKTTLLTRRNRGDASRSSISGIKRLAAQKTSVKQARLIRAPAVRAFRIASIVTRSRELPYATVSLGWGKSSGQCAAEVYPGG